MRSRTLIAGAATMLVVVLASIAVVAAVFIARFDRIELDQTREKAAQGLRAIEADLDQLAISTRDYAEWDDAQQYVAERNPAFLQANFSYDSLSGMQVDAMAMIAADGTVLYSAAVDESRHVLTGRTDPALLERLRALVPAQASLRELESTRRLLATPQGLLGFAGVEIRRSDKSQPTGVIMYFCRFLDSDEISRARKTSQLPLELHRLGRLPPELPESVLAWVHANIRDSDVMARAMNDTDVSGYGILKDITGAPIALLTLSVPRTLAQLGRRTTMVALGTVALLLTGCGIALAWMVMRLQRSIEARTLLEQRHRNILRHLDETILLADRDTGCIVDANEALLEALDYRREDLTHLSLRQIYIDLEEASRDSPALCHGRIRARDGRLIEVELSISRVEDEGRQLLCIVGRDLSLRREAEARLKQSEERLLRMVEFDELTGLASRAGLQRQLEERLHGAAGRQLALFHVDVDHFKNVNDLYGHAFGDRLLGCMADQLRNACDADTLLARMGGDEFALLCAIDDAGALRAQALRAQALRIQAALRREIDIEDRAVRLTASVGVAVYPQDGQDSATLLKRADMALYRAKESGRDTYCQFSSEMDAQLSENILLEQALRRAIGTAQIYVEYQPVIDLHTGMLVSFEALARWRHPEMGSVSPARFIPIAERSGLILQLGEAVTRQVVLQLHQWQRDDVPLVPVAVNVSPLQFERTAFSNFVHELLMQYELEPSWLAFEITESAWLQDSNRHIVAIDTLRHAGSRIYIDDFGTGFSNLAYLKALPVDALKIDQSFVRGMASDPNDAAIVSGIIHMASQLKLRIIAEGVETAELADRLRALGCHYAQGYYFSKPMPAAQCKALLQQMSETRRFTETVRMRAFKAAS